MMGVRHRVLVADDSPQVRMVLSKMFSKHETLEICDEAVNGQDAVEKARWCQPELVILDLSMPVMNGLEAAKVIRRMFPAVPIILFTQHVGLFQATNPSADAVTKVVSKSDMHKLPEHAVEALRAA
jgi:CheY-like chemotaxis protein